MGLNPVTNIYIARIHWSGPANSPLIGKGHPKERVMETRPSQAIGLALHFDAPIFVSRSVSLPLCVHTCNTPTPASLLDTMGARGDAGRGGGAQLERELAS